MKRSRNPFAIAAVLGVLALLGLLTYGILANAPDRGIDGALGRGERVPAPGFELARLSGPGEGSLANYRGKVVVLNFWASWCEPCRAESPLLERWHKRISRDDRATVLGVAVLDVASDARRFTHNFKLSYPMLHDGAGSVLPDYGVVGYPETFVIDRGGKVAAARRGPVDEAFMREEVAPLVAEGA